MEIGDRILKDGKPGTVVGWGDGEDAVDLILDDQRETFIRYPGRKASLFPRETLDPEDFPETTP